jgi:hypothetical protein
MDQGGPRRPSGAQRAHRANYQHRTTFQARHPGRAIGRKADEPDWWRKRKRWWLQYRCRIHKPQGRPEEGQGQQQEDYPLIRFDDTQAVVAFRQTSLRVCITPLPSGKEGSICSIRFACANEIAERGVTCHLNPGQL